MSILKRQDIEIIDGYVKIPEDKYNFLMQIIEEGMDLDALREARESDEEAFPIELFDAIDAGENPIRAFRNYRELTQGELADMVGIKQNMISSIENGKRDGTIKVLVSIARALNVDIDMLVDTD